MDELVLFSGGPDSTILLIDLLKKKVPVMPQYNILTASIQSHTSLLLVIMIQLKDFLKETDLLNLRLTQLHLVFLNKHKMMESIHNRY